MSRKVRLFISLLCCLLTFLPINEHWVRAEESATLTTTDPQPGNGSVEEKSDTQDPKVCPEVPADTQPISDQSSNTSTDNPTGEGTSADPKTDPGQTTEPTNDQTCADENPPPILDPGNMGISRSSITFNDVSSSYWAYLNIQHLSTLNVINGYENSDKTFSFKPDEKVTRAQAAKMIIEAIHEKQATPTKQIYKDIPVTYWAAGYIQRAYELGIFGGYDDGRFGPTETLKRSQMAKVIVEAYRFDFNGYTPSTPVFNDVNSNYWAYEYIEKMHYNGMTNGNNYRFLPEDLISRAQFSAFLSRAIEPTYRLKVTGPITTKGRVISLTSLNIRSKASGSSTILGKLPPGTLVNITEFNGFWGKVTYNGITGYVHKSYLKLYSSDLNYPLKDRIIVIDPGHGLNDPGTHYNGYNEKDIVLSVGKKVVDKLRAAGAKVIMTRESDTYPTLEERVKKAEDVYAELFVSIHINSVENNTTAKGTETYYNTSNNMNGAESRLLATEIQKQIVEKADMYDRGIKDTGFYVIKNNQIPAVLVEMGFLPNKEDRDKLISDQYQSIYAESIFQGIKSYYLR